MTVNTFVLSGEVKRLDINTKSTKKGPAAIIVLQYDKSRQRTDQAVQFVNAATLRVPHYLYSKDEIKDNLKVGSLIDVVGRVQGVLKMGFMTVELVASNLQVVDADSPADDDAATGENRDGDAGLNAGSGFVPDEGGQELLAA